MKKQNFITLVLGVIGGLMFSLGLCMCLLPEWNAFSAGVVVTTLGSLLLLGLFLVCWKKSGKQWNIPWKLAGRIAYGVVSVLVLGIGMCLVLVWQRMISGIAVGILGVILLLGLIPLCLGLK